LHDIALHELGVGQHNATKAAGVPDTARRRYRTGVSGIEVPRAVRAIEVGLHDLYTSAAPGTGARCSLISQARHELQRS
jgi:hypothetical protein